MFDLVLKLVGIKQVGLQTTYRVSRRAKLQLRKLALKKLAAEIKKGKLV